VSSYRSTVLPVAIRRSKTKRVQHVPRHGDAKSRGATTTRIASAMIFLMIFRPIGSTFSAWSAMRREPICDHRAPSDRALPCGAVGSLFSSPKSIDGRRESRTFGPAGSYYLKTTEGASHDFGFRAPAGAKFFGTGGTASPLVRSRLAGRASAPTPIPSRSVPQSPGELHRGSPFLLLPRFACTTARHQRSALALGKVKPDCSAIAKH
jgi:hypothetical protein